MVPEIPLKIGNSKNNMAGSLKLSVFEVVYFWNLHLGGTAECGVTTIGPDGTCQHYYSTSSANHSDAQKVKVDSKNSYDWLII